MENLLKKYTNSDKLKVKNNEEQKSSKIKEEVLVPVQIEKTKDEEDNPEMEAEYLLEEFQSPSQNEICIKEEMIEFDDCEMEDEDDIELISPILQTSSEQIKTKLKPSTKSCSK